MRIRFGTRGHPQYSGSVVLAARHGVVVELSAQGYSLRYASEDGDELPREKWIPTTTKTLYDVASLSKIFTSIVALQLVDQGRLDLDATVASYVSEFAQQGKRGVTVRQLLTHTSGLPPDPSPGLWRYDSREQKVAAVYATELQADPGTTYIYSDVNMITLQFLEERIIGTGLDALVRAGITEPLGMRETRYNPPASWRARIAAAEYQKEPDRGLVWGQVHDENAWALGGVAGHAGVFSTAGDLAVLCQMMLNRGSAGGHRILSRDSAVAMRACHPEIPGPVGLGFETNQPRYMGALAGPATIGHTGFTGTSLVIDPVKEAFAIVLTNAVHPRRGRGSVNPLRRAVADALAHPIPRDVMQAQVPSSCR